MAANEADGPRATCSGAPTATAFSSREGVGAADLSVTVHLDDALRRRLPVALATWAERPSEGRALLGWLRVCPSSASPEHPFVTGGERREGWRVLSSASEPAKTLVQTPPREGERCLENQGAFDRQQRARVDARLLSHVRDGSVSPHAAPSEGALRSGPPPFPMEEPSLGF